MSKGFVTSVEVARLAGVSRATVSRCFSHSHIVSPELRARVQAAADQLGYRVNRLAQNLQTERSNIVGVIGTHLERPYTAVQLADLSAALMQVDLQCLLMNPTGRESDLVRPIQMMLEYRVRAMIILSGAPPQDLVDECIRNDVRVILINRPSSSALAYVIEVDALGGGRMAAKRLLREQRKRFAVIQSGSKTPAKLNRARGFQEVIRAAGHSAILWTEGESCYSTGVQAAHALLTKHQPDGVFCVTDEIGLGFIDTARHELGMSIPQDFSLIAFDDVAQAGWSAYQMTTITQPVPALTHAVLRVLGAVPAPRADGSDAPVDSNQPTQPSDDTDIRLQTIKVHLTERQTTLPLAALSLENSAARMID